MSNDGFDKWFPVIISAAVLGLFALAGSTLVGLSFEATAERIEQNEREALLRRLGQIVPQDRYDNDMLADVITIDGVEELGGGPVRVFRARKDKQDVAAIFSPVVTPGYAGYMSLIVGIYSDGRVAGVRVLRHHETPGLGDKIELSRSDWILEFDGRNLQDPPVEKWKVKRDGGVFDQFTGATITPRLVVSAVRRTLEYFSHHQGRLFSQPAEAGAGSVKDSSDPGEPNG